MFLMKLKLNELQNKTKNQNLINYKGINYATNDNRWKIKLRP